MEEWLLPAQLYIQNKFREAFDAVEDQLPEHTVLEPEGNKSSFTVTFPSWKERDDAHAVLANGGVRFRSGKALVPFRITGNIDWGVPVPEVDGVSDVTCWCWPESLWAPISYTRTVLARDAKAAGVTEGVAAQDAALMGEPAADSTQVPAPTYQHSSLDWRDWWCSDDAQIYQFIGQDNIYFYCIAQTAMWEARQRLLPPALHGQKGKLVLADASPAGRRPAQPLHLRADARALAVARPVREAGEL